MKSMMKIKGYAISLLERDKTMADRRITLGQLLSTTPNIPVKIKTSASRWVYAYYNDENLTKRLTKESNRFIQDMQQRLLARVEQYNSLDETLKAKLDKISKMKDLPKPKREMLKQKALSKYNKDKDLLPKVIDNQKDKIKAYKPYLDRKVRRVWNLPKMTPYESPKTLYIEITGKEIGEYDDMHDYARKNHLPLNKDDSFWRNNISKEKQKYTERKKQIVFVKPKRNVRYTLKRDSEGNALGLVEIKPTRKGRR